MVKNIKSIIIIFAIFTFMLVVYLISTSFFESKAYNFMVQTFSATKHGSSDIVVIAIDDRSLDRIRWPWKRVEYAKGFEYLNKYCHPKLVGFDALIATPDAQDPESDLVFFNSVKNFDNLSVGFVPLYQLYQSKLDGQRYDIKFKNKFGIKIKDSRSNKTETYYNSLSKFPLGYFNSVKNVGSVLTTPDYDGYIRSIDQLVDYKGHLYPSLSLKMYQLLHPNETFEVSDKYITMTNTDLKIPVISRENGVYNNIHYYNQYSNSEYAHKTFSAIDVLDSLEAIKKGKTPKIPPSEFKNKIVFWGANAKAIAIGLEDVKRTPISNDYPGVDIQATNFDNIYHNEFLRQSTPSQDVVSMLILIAITFLLIRYFSLFVSLSFVSLLMVIYIVVCVICYKFNYVVNVITPITMQVITMTMAYSYRFILEGRNKEKIKNAMGKFISNDVMQSVVKDIDDVKLGGKRANVTVLFADIRGFTSMSENMTAEEVSVILNEYFTEIEPIIRKHNGVINKFIGDAVMAIFGEPIQDKNHAINAVKCANDMLKKVKELQQKWLAEGKPRIEIGVGINTGDAFVGNIGSESRLEYTVIGDMVNLASRIESYNKVYKTSFLISSTTYEKVRNIADVIRISEVSIRGKSKKLDIYEVLRLVK